MGWSAPCMTAWSPIAMASRTGCATLLDIGSGWNDAVLFAEAWRRAQGSGDPCRACRTRRSAGRLAGAPPRNGSAGLGLRSRRRGLAEQSPGRASRRLSLLRRGRRGRRSACGAAPRRACGFLQAFAANLLQVSVRLGVTGQSGAITTMAALEPLVLKVAGRAATSSLDDLGSATIMSDIMAMKHEIQYSRLFRS